tara:strand:+ start:442 stop:735 length:294 start_codon:yes stop_codon:yes gene_type:complete
METLIAQFGNLPNIVFLMTHKTGITTDKLILLSVGFHKLNNESVAQVVSVSESSKLCPLIEPLAFVLSTGSRPANQAGSTLFHPASMVFSITNSGVT